MAISVYVLCALTSLACGLLLLRGYQRDRVRLLLWTALCFLGLGANNMLLVIDVVFATDLVLIRKLPALVGVVLLIHGLIADSR